VHDDDHQTYPPLNTLKPVAENVWIVDAPLIRFGPPLLKMSFPTRMTIIRLKNGLFIHSPTVMDEGLRAEVIALGLVRWIIGPNRIHYWWIPEWRAAFPDAEVFLAPRIREQAGSRIDFEAQGLSAVSGYPWDEGILTLPVEGDYMTEVEFFHPASRTLVLTDFIENFEPQKVSGWLMRLMTRLGGVADPNGAMPRDMRMTFRNQKPQLKAAIETMIGWDPLRVILAHGRWYDKDGTADLRRAFQWIL
jgi:hypothetical protein